MRALLVMRNGLLEFKLEQMRLYCIRAAAGRRPGFLFGLG
jgi:hypothetical protein